jgi:hypothetical protein
MTCKPLLNYGNDIVRVLLVLLGEV